MFIAHIITLSAARTRRFPQGTQVHAPTAMRSSAARDVQLGPLSREDVADLKLIAMQEGVEVLLYGGHAHLKKLCHAGNTPSDRHTDRAPGRRFDCFDVSVWLVAARSLAEV